MIYLDNAATTRVSDEVMEAMLPWMQEHYGNPGSLHALGREAKEAVDDARSKVAAFLGCSPSQVIFTSGGSEGNSLILNGIVPELKRRGKTRVVSSRIEHDSVYKSVQHLKIKHGFDIDFADPNRNGCVEHHAVLPLITPETGLVSVMTVNNETGISNPVVLIGGLCRERGVLFHTDAVQAAGSHELSVIAEHCDFMTVSSHKIHGPKGVGAVFARDPSLLEPLIRGGANQEHGLRGGTENVAGVVGFAKACEIARRERIAAGHSIEALFGVFSYTLGLELSDVVSIHRNGFEYGACKILNLRFDGVDAETLLLMLDAAGVCVSAGSACRSHESVPSRVLTSMGLSAEEARGSIRISFSGSESVDEARQAARLIAGCVKILKGV